MNELELYNDTVFDSIKHVNEYGNEYWLARELMPILQYSNWQNFEKIINKAITACSNSDFNVINHFIDVSKMVAIGSGAYRKQKDVNKAVKRNIESFHHDFYFQLTKEEFENLRF